MIAWGRMPDIQREVAHVPQKWLAGFAIAHPGDVRKLGSWDNAAVLFRSTAVLAAIEAGEFYTAPGDAKSTPSTPSTPSMQSTQPKQERSK